MVKERRMNVVGDSKEWRTVSVRGMTQIFRPRKMLTKCAVKCVAAAASTTGQRRSTRANDTKVAGTKADDRDGKERRQDAGQDTRLSKRASI